MDRVVLYCKSSTNKIKILELSIKNKNELHTRWGFIDNEENWQHTFEVIKGKNLGRSNETSDSEQCLFEFNRKIRLKTESGYTTDLDTLSQEKELINWTNATIIDSFAPSKPDKELDPKLEKELIASQNLLWQRKRNGQRHFCIKGDSAVNIYSRQMELRTERFQEYANMLQNFLPPRTIIDCEITTLDDDPDLVKTICSSKPEKAQLELEKLRANNNNIIFYQFDCLYFKGEDITQKPYIERWELLKNWNHVLQRVENYYTKPKIDPSWEGLVAKKINGTTRIRTDGKPEKRSSFQWKVKEFREADLVCIRTEVGSGKLANTVGTLILGAYDKNGKLVEVCRAGSGLTEEQRDFIRDNLKDKLFVCEIRFEEYIEKSGSLRLPTIKRINRDDKKPQECLLEDIK